MLVGLVVIIWGSLNCTIFFKTASRACSLSLLPLPVMAQHPARRERIQLRFGGARTTYAVVNCPTKPMDVTCFTLSTKTKLPLGSSRQACPDPSIRQPDSQSDNHLAVADAFHRKGA